MAALRLFCLVTFAVIAVYTVVVIAEHGPNLFPVFFGDMALMGWPGQFNLDFMFMLAFSALWTAWRNEFSGPGLGLAILAFFLGAPFLSLYLLYLSFQTGGDPVRMLIGERATTPQQ